MHLLCGRRRRLFLGSFHLALLLARQFAIVRSLFAAALQMLGPSTMSLGLLRRMPPPSTLKTPCGHYQGPISGSAALQTLLVDPLAPVADKVLDALEPVLHVGLDKAPAESDRQEGFDNGVTATARFFLFQESHRYEKELVEDNIEFDVDSLRVWSSARESCNARELISRPRDVVSYNAPDRAVGSRGDQGVRRQQPRAGSTAREKSSAR